MAGIPHQFLLNTTGLMSDNFTAETIGYGGYYNVTDHVLEGGGPMGGPPYGPPPPPSPDIVMLQAIVRGLALYLSPVLAIGGILGNLMCLLCLGVSGSKTSGRCFGTALIAAETIQLLTLLQDWVTEMGLDLYVVSGWCHLKMFLADGSKFLSTWYLVSVLVSCLLSNCFPDRECCSPWRHLVLTLTLAILALVVYLNISLTATLLYVAQHPVCMYMRTPDSSIAYLTHVDTFINILLPLLVNSFSCFCLCLVKCCCSTRSNRGAREQIVDFRFILIHNALWMTYEVARFHNGLSVLSANLSQNTQLRNFLWEQIFKFVSYFNMAITVFVMFGTSTLFKKQARDLFHAVSNKFCASCSKRMNSTYFRYASAAAQTSFIEANGMIIETV